MDEISKITGIIINREKVYKEKDLGEYCLVFLKPLSIMQRVGLPRGALCFTEERILIFWPSWSKPFWLEMHYADVLKDNGKVIDVIKWPNTETNKLYKNNQKILGDLKYQQRFDMFICAFKNIIESYRIGDTQKYKNNLNNLKQQIKKMGY